MREGCGGGGRGGGGKEGVGLGRGCWSRGGLLCVWEGSGVCLIGLGSGDTYTYDIIRYFICLHDGL